MDTVAVRAVIDAWASQYLEIGSLPFINHVQIFENRGEMMGASNPHPHGQIWATEHIPNDPKRELEAQKEYSDKHHSCLLCDYVATEIAEAERIVGEFI